MIKVRYYKNRGRCALEVTGHADAGEPGHDIVCAAASGIITALLGYVANAPEHVKCIYNFTQERGHAFVDADGDEAIAGAFDAAYMGMLHLSAKYPENVSVES